MSELFSYQTVKQKGESFYKDKGSKFYGFVFPITSEEDIKTLLDEIKAIHPKARHVCYAYRLGINETQEKAADAGEPNGSAGLPILNQLRSSNLDNCLAIVVRYFGGTKLGIPGLINAYKTSTQLTIEANKIITKELKKQYTLHTNFENANLVFQLANQLEGNILEHDYSSAEVVFKLEIPLRLKESFEAKIEESQHLRLD